ncbi:MAG: PA domain-containing protein [Actinomycetota bacterium]
MLVGGPPAPAVAHPGQHGENEGHLLGTGAEGKIELVGQLEVTQTEGLVADVAAFGNYAYLANWGEPDCAGPERGGVTSPDAGAWVIDISDPANPQEVNFIPMPQDTRPGEGMQVLHVETSMFSGDMLVMNAEACGKNYKGGFMLYDVTDPLKPVKLGLGWGERTRSDTHQTHSAFVWQPPGSTSAYLVLQDEEDLADLDIFDITNPRRPRQIAELDLNEFGVAQPALNLATSNLHDMTVKCMATGTYAGRCIMIASYWDGGYVLLDVTDPASPDVLFDTDFAAVDPELLEQTGVSLTPEGNAHQAEFTADNRFFIGTDEDFAPHRSQISTDDGGLYDAGEFSWTVPVRELEDGTLDGPTVFGGYGCPADRGSIPSASTLTLAGGEEAILVLQRGPLDDPSRSGGACLFSEKVETAQLLGYDAVIIANHHRGALGGEGPDTYLCGSMGHVFDVEIPALCVGHRAMHELFDDPDAADNFTYPEAVPSVGTVGDRVTVATTFDGWGYVHLFDAATGQELDTFAIPEAMDPAYASGFGDLTVHEVATDPTDPSLAYLSYYAGGLVALQIQCTDPGDTTTCELVEVGSYLDPDGNNLWGVEVVANPADDPDVQGDEQLILASDRDYGLFIFRDP